MKKVDDPASVELGDSGVHLVIPGMSRDNVEVMNWLEEVAEKVTDKLSFPVRPLARGKSSYEEVMAEMRRRYPLPKAVAGTELPPVWVDEAMTLAPGIGKPTEETVRSRPYFTGGETGGETRHKNRLPEEPLTATDVTRRIEQDTRPLVCAVDLTPALKRLGRLLDERQKKKAAGGFAKHVSDMAALVPATSFVDATKKKKD